MFKVQIPKENHQYAICYLVFRIWNFDPVFFSPATLYILTFKGFCRLHSSQFFFHPPFGNLGNILKDRSVLLGVGAFRQVRNLRL